MDVTTYFAWVTSGDLTFDPAFARTDERLLSYRLEQREGEFATLTVQVVGTGAGRLTVGAKQWGWLSRRLGTELVPRFFGRLDAVETINSDDVKVVVLHLVAEPIDYAEQKKAIANSLRVLPRYDLAFIDEQSWDDDDIVLEGYTLRYHTDPVTHVVTVSDELIGEDGVEEFLATDMLYGGFSMGLASVPASSITVNAKMTWTQQAQGSVDLSSYLITNWPGVAEGAIRSFTFSADSWPKAGGSLGSGWNVASSSCKSLYDLTIRNISSGFNIKSDLGSSPSSEEGDDGVLPTVSTTGTGNNTISVSRSDDQLRKTPPGSISLPRIITDLNIQSRFDDDGELTSYSRSETSVEGLLAVNYLVPSLSAGYNAKRSCVENVSLTLVADIQEAIGTNSQNQALEPIDLQTSNLSEPIELETGGESPIVDPRRRSYVCTDRGQLSLQYMIARAQSALLLSSRAVESTFSPYLERMPSVTLRKNARIHRGEIPGGVAEGKIIGFFEEQARGSGFIDCRVIIGSAIGHGGAISQVNGVGTYVEEDYFGPDDDYQEQSGGTEMFDSSVGYTPPLFAPNDDGLDFIGGFTGADAFDEPLTVDNSYDVQAAALAAGIGGFRMPLGLPVVPAWLASAVVRNSGIFDDALTTGDMAAKDRETYMNNLLSSVKTVAHFKLKSMTRSFETDVPVTVTQLKVPTMINLEAP